MCSHVCTRCVLRAENFHVPEAFEKPTATKPPTCSICLGILQEPALNSVTSTLKGKLASFTHANQLKVNVTIPAAISIVRDRAFGLAVALGHYPAIKPTGKTLSPIPLTKVFKWAISGRMARLFNIQYDQDAELFLDVIFRHEKASAEIDLDADLSPPAKSPRFNHKPYRRTTDSTAQITRRIDALSDETFKAQLSHLIPPPALDTTVDVTTSISVATARLAGTYNKWSRIVSQTPWFIDQGDTNGERAGSEGDQSKGRSTASRHTNGDEEAERNNHKRTALSVEDVVLAGVRSVLKPEKATFSAGGREDVDVRMLGGGRPFMIEVVNPCIIPSLISDTHISEMAQLSKDKASSVSVNDLRLVVKQFTTQMKAVETEKRKHYRCLVWSSRAVDETVLHGMFNNDEGFALQQRTPLRVLHRRVQMVRERQVYKTVVARVVSPNFFVLDVVAQAGTYIKEFVHGDSGRTVPSVAALLECDADILQLDVVKIDINEAS